MSINYHSWRVAELLMLLDVHVLSSERAMLPPYVGS